MASSFRNSRIVVASLFLPTTVVLGDSGQSTPVISETGVNGLKSDIEVPSFRLGGDKKQLLTPSTPSTGSGGGVVASAGGTGASASGGKPPHARTPSFTGPLRSIVDDLKDKSRVVSPAVSTPASEQANPFFLLNLAQANSNLANAISTTAQPSDTVGPIPERRHQTTHSDVSPRIRRKSSRSSTRRSIGTGSIPPYHFEPNVHCNGGLKNALDSMASSNLEVLWVGTLGAGTDGFSDKLKTDVDRRMRLGYDSVPVWIPDKEFESCYDEFCHQVLWPCLHYAIPDAPKTKSFYESASYKQYVAVNQRFADAIVKNYEEGDIIWVNDYHLLLLPLMLRNALPPSTPIGFFLHVAFPSSEIFRCLSVRKDLLMGMTGADLVGFQTASYARHFRGTISRVMAWEAVPRGVWVGDSDTISESKFNTPYKSGSRTPGSGRRTPTPGLSGANGALHASSPDIDGDEDVLGVGYETKIAESIERGRFVDVGVFPMGIDVSALDTKKKNPEVAEWISVLKQRYAGMKMIVGRDKLDEVQGVRQKLMAFEAFLDKYPQFQGKVVLLQVALQTTESNELAVNVADIVSRINSRFSTLTYQPIVFLHTQDLTFDQYLALLSVADAFLVCSLREGMALRTHEFVECQEGKHRPLILSEFTGSYSYSGFRSCIAINPWDTRGTASAINQALTMDDDEALSRWEDLHAHVTTQTAQAFVTSFLSRCIRANKSTNFASAASSVERLNTSMTRVLPRYKHSIKRLIFIDFEGTLWVRSGADGVVPLNAPPVPENVVEVLSKLVSDRKNEVWLLSGLPVKGTLQELAQRLPKLGIVAENGCFIKSRETGRRGSISSNLADGAWVNMVANFNFSWKSSCMEILNYFTERTPGSHVEEREASIVWRFWMQPSMADSPDRQWALRQAAEAQNHIFDSLGERYGLRIIPGKTSFLVLPTNISRSSAVGAILHPGGPQHHAPSTTSYLATSPTTASWMSLDVNATGGGEEADFIFALSKDDQLLRRLNEFDCAETCSTSGKGTDAKWRLDPKDSLTIMDMFAGISSGSSHHGVGSPTSPGSPSSIVSGSFAR